MLPAQRAIHVGADVFSAPRPSQQKVDFSRRRYRVPVVFLHEVRAGIMSRQHAKELADFVFFTSWEINLVRSVAANGNTSAEIVRYGYISLIYFSSVAVLISSMKFYKYCKDICIWGIYKCLYNRYRTHNTVMALCYLREKNHS